MRYPLAVSVGINFRGTLAEQSKAKAQGAIPKGRGFEPHRCHFVVAPVRLCGSVCVCVCMRLHAFASYLEAKPVLSQDRQVIHVHYLKQFMVSRNDSDSNPCGQSPMDFESVS